MFLIACSAISATLAATPAEPQMRMGRWEMTRSWRNIRTTVNGVTSSRPDKGPWTSTSICSGGPLPGKLPPPTSQINPRGCVIKSYEATSHTARMTTHCPSRGGGWRDDDVSFTFSPIRVDYVMRTTVNDSLGHSSLEEYGTQRWLGPCAKVP
jgi:hypothetical protein